MRRNVSSLMDSSQTVSAVGRFHPSPSTCQALAGAPRTLDYPTVNPRLTVPAVGIRV